MAKKWWFAPQADNSVSETAQVLPDLAGLIEGSDAAAPFPDTILYPPTPSGNRSWRWLLIAFASCCTAGSVAIGAFLWLINLPPNADCSQLSTLSSDRAQLYCAQSAAESGELQDLVAGLDLLGQWTPEHPLHREVQPLVDQWSEAALTAAREKLAENDLTGAIALVKRIPSTSPTYEVAQAAIAAWQQEWNQGDAIFAKAQTALKQKDWATASEQISALSQLDNGFWQVQQVQTLSQQIRQEKQAQRLLAQAKTLASPGGIERLSGALRATSQIDPSTYTWQEAQPFMDSWSDLLLSVATDKWYAAQLDEAITLGQRIALNPNRAQVAQELIWLSQARKLALKSVSDWRTSPQQIMGLYRAMLLVNQIAPESRFYPQAQSSLASWKVHLQDLGQIQIAQTIGSFANRDALEVAIAKAAVVPADHPRRQQAQTLISHWGREIQRIEDRPFLKQAHQLAQTKTLTNLQRAIATASEIRLGRALRQEAQSWIYVWNNQSQVLEDQPILNRAQALASQGNLPEAIAEASLIKSDRALSGEARSAISTWNARIREAELARLRARQEALAQPILTPNAAEAAIETA
ncbi:MAG: hypothetical protein ICV77_14875, partial [Cyanobacteria bacterium Co-bin8]|nr:hypothetical protein [Cyanobacteria bacterium Co-bin8]